MKSDVTTAGRGRLMRWTLICLLLVIPLGMYVSIIYKIVHYGP